MIWSWIGIMERHAAYPSLHLESFGKLFPCHLVLLMSCWPCAAMCQGLLDFIWRKFPGLQLIQQGSYSGITFRNIKSPKAGVWPMSSEEISWQIGRAFQWQRQGALNWSQCTNDHCQWLNDCLCQCQYLIWPGTWHFVCCLRSAFQI